MNGILNMKLTGNGFAPANSRLTVCQKKSVPSMGSIDQKVNVYVWDVDETLILLKSLLDGTFARGFNGAKDVKKGMEIGKHWENRILQVCDELFFYEQIEDYNEPFLDSVSEYDDGRDLSNYDFSKDSLSFPYDNSNKSKLAYRHRIIAQKYSQGLKCVLDEGKIKLWDDLYDLTDSYTDGWLSSARAFLKQISSRNEGLNINVLVTSGSLIPTLAKCLLFRFDDLILHENVYSSWEVGKFQCFSWIKERFSGPSVRFCAIGDGFEECGAAEKMRWPFVKIDIHPKGIHRFPGLTTRTLGHYMDVIYGGSESDED